MRFRGWWGWGGGGGSYRTFKGQLHLYSEWEPLVGLWLRSNLVWLTFEWDPCYCRGKQTGERGKGRSREARLETAAISQLREVNLPKLCRQKLWQPVSKDGPSEHTFCESGPCSVPLSWTNTCLWLMGGCRSFMLCHLSSDNFRICSFGSSEPPCWSPATVSPLHMNEFCSESAFVNLICSKSDEASLGTQITQAAI